MRKRQSPGRDTRFKPGASGNPKGRPRKPSATTQGRETLMRLLDEVVAHRDGKGITAFEAMVLKVRKTILEEGKLADFSSSLICAEPLECSSRPRTNAGATIGCAAGAGTLRNG